MRLEQKTGAEHVPVREKVFDTRVLSDGRPVTKCRRDRPLPVRSLRERQRELVWRLEHLLGPVGQMDRPLPVRSPLERQRELV